MRQISQKNYYRDPFEIVIPLRFPHLLNVLTIYFFHEQALALQSGKEKEYDYQDHWEVKLIIFCLLFKHPKIQGSFF